MAIRAEPARVCANGGALLVVAAMIATAPFEGRDAAAAPSSSRCSATRVHHEPNPALGTLNGGPWIAALPVAAHLIAFLFGGEEVNGRFALYAGGRNPVSGTSEKILWIVPQDARAGATLRLTGQRLRFDSELRKYEPVGRSFGQTFGPASSEQTPGRLFPSIVKAPRAGCWRLVVRTGRVHAVVVAVVQPIRRR